MTKKRRKPAARKPKPKPVARSATATPDPARASASVPLPEPIEAWQEPQIVVVIEKVGFLRWRWRKHWIVGANEPDIEISKTFFTQKAAMRAAREDA